MNLLRLGPALERLVDSIGGDAVAVDATACVRHWNHASGCRLCADGCPTQAIALPPWESEGAGQAVTLDPAACVECGYCLHACPTGVFTGRDETDRLLQTAAALPVRAEIDLACRYAPVREAEPGVDAIVEAGGCLAALGAAAYVGLAAAGVERIGVRVEGCGQCPIGSLVTAIAQAAETAGVLAAIPITVKDAPTPGAVRKPVHATHARPISRRGLWQRLAGGGARPAAPTPTEVEEPEGGGKRLPSERKALLGALAELPAERRANGPAFPRLSVAATCTACQVCANVCPTGAILFAADGETFSLQFAPLACTDCGLCLQLCAPQALQPAGKLAYDDAHPAVLHTGQQRECKRCRALFAGAGDLCPACDFRRRNPTGMRLPTPG